MNEIAIWLFIDVIYYYRQYFKFQVSSGGETWYINCGITDFVELHEQVE